VKITLAEPFSGEIVTSFVLLHKVCCTKY